MPGYVRKALLRFDIDLDNFNQWTNTPGEYLPVRYGKQITTVDTSPAISADRAKRIQQIIGVFLYYARMVDPTMLCRVGQLASWQAFPTQELDDAVTHFLHYAATWPNAGIRYHKSDMVLHCQADGSYLSEPNAGSRVGGISYLGSAATDYSADAPPSAVHGTISVRS